MGAARHLVVLAATLVGATGCPGGSPERPDAGDPIDASIPADVSESPDSGRYEHTIVIDGTNDFSIAETFSTTTAGYAAYLAWDRTAFYLGYQGSDVAITAPDSPTKWVLVYIDVDPLANSGVDVGETYNTQQPGFPPGFRPDYYYRWKSDDSFSDLRRWDGNAWTTEPTAPSSSVAGMFMEAAIPLAALGNPSEIGVVTLMLNEKSLGEWSYAGLFMNNFTDGYYATPIPITAFLSADLRGAVGPEQ